MLTLGTHTLDNNVALAPMAGVTDLPFRKLCRELGAGLVVSEMISSDPGLRHSRKSSLRRVHDEECSPRSIQIAGSDPQQMAAAAVFNVEQGAQVIDINMGCPAKKVCRKAAGSALLRDEQLVNSILRSVVGALDVPVTLKIRTGWSPEQRNGATIARIAEDAGISALAVHGRTRACRFDGAAEYDTIATICATVSIPVWANGDINSPQKAKQVLDHTGAAGVMIGRAAQGQPWLPGQIAHFLEHGIDPGQPSAARQTAILLRHLQDLYQFYGEYSGVRVARKHVGWYLQDTPDNRAFRKLFNTLESAGAQQTSIESYLSGSEYKELAA